MDDFFFNGFYPVIDFSTGGKVNEMIAAADRIAVGLMCAATAVAGV